MCNKYVLIGIVVGVLLSSVAVVLAGEIDSPEVPTHADAQMYTLKQIYDRLDTGAESDEMTTFTEPDSGPASTMNTLDEIMAKAPAVDDTDGAGVADVASGKKFWGLTSVAWGLQTGTATGGPTYEAGVPKTGDTYNDGCCTGEDGELQKGVSWPSLRFTDNSDGTVTDNLTGLIWLKDANCWGTQTTWANALTNANGLASGSCGLTDGSSAGDWRLPNVRELFSLIDHSQDNPALPSGHPFDAVESDKYWSSTTMGDPSKAWYVHLNLGTVLGSYKTTNYYVWPVRGGQ